MKKLVLGVMATFAAIIYSNAQTTIIFDGTAASKLNGGPYTFAPTAGVDGATNTGSISAPVVSNFLNVTATVSGGFYAGGWGNAQYGANGEEGWGYAGSVAGSSFFYTYASTDSVKIKFQFTTPGPNSVDYGYLVEFKSAPSPTLTTVSIPLSNMLAIVGNDPTGTPVTDAILQQFSKFQLVFNVDKALGAGTVNITIGGFKFGATPVTTSNSNSNYSLSSELALSPNPTSEGYINVTTDLNISNISVLNAQGAPVNASVNGNRVNTTTLTPGVYTLLIDTEKGRTAKKIIVE